MWGAFDPLMDGYEFAEQNRDREFLPDADLIPGTDQYELTDVYNSTDAEVFIGQGEERRRLRRGRR